MNLLRAMVELTHRNTRRYGGYLVHMGIVLMFIGFTGHAFNQSEVKEMSQGDTMRIGHPMSCVWPAWSRARTPITCGIAAPSRFPRTAAAGHLSPRSASSKPARRALPKSPSACAQ
jgi:hypothetical protein